MPPYRYLFEAMTTRCELQFHGVSQAEGDAVAAAITRRVAELVQKYNFHAADSWLSREVNGRSGERVRLDAECAAVLALVREHSARCHGAFDITVGTLSAALRQVDSVAAVAAIRQQLAPALGLDAWQLDGEWLHFAHPATRLDLGGVIKEYAVDEAVRIAREHGIGSGLINFGGDLYAIGSKPDGSRFVAAVSHPGQPEQLLFGLDLQDQALTTSGHYARHRLLADGLLSHIVPPHSSQAAPWASVSVVSHSALLCGLYSTALLVDATLALPADCFGVAIDGNGKLQQLGC